MSVPNGVPVTLPAYIKNDWGVIRRAEIKDISYLSANLREEDKSEIQASSGKNPEEGMRHVVSLEDSWVVVLCDEPYIIWGHQVHDLTAQQATIWCLATPKLLNHKTAFLRIAEAWLQTLEVQFKYLNCFADSRNKEHHRWLRFMDFKRIGEPCKFFDPEIDLHEYVRGN